MSDILIGTLGLTSFFSIQKNMTKQQLMELAVQEQFKGKQELEKKMQKLVKTMDHLERAKREEAAPLVEAAFHKRLAEEKLLHERQQEVFCKLSVGLSG